MQAFLSLQPHITIEINLLQSRVTTENMQQEKCGENVPKKTKDLMQEQEQ